MGPIEVPIHGFLANPIPVGMVTPARPYAEAAQGRRRTGRGAEFSYFRQTNSNY